MYKMTMFMDEIIYIVNILICPKLICKLNFIPRTILVGSIWEKF